MEIYMQQKIEIAKQNTPAGSGKAQTGPKTQEGKEASSKNAQKGGIFTQGYLPTEDIAQKQLEYEALTRQWAAYDPSRQIILRTIEQASLGIERQMCLERQKIEGLMLSADIRHQFASHAGINLLVSPNLPAWYFSPAGHEEKHFALLIAKVFNQAHHFKTYYSDQMAHQIKERYPDLYDYVMEGQKVTAQFLIVLGQTYRQSTAIFNLMKLIEKLEADYRHHLIWAGDSERYQLILDSIRAQQIEAAIDLDKSNRYATNLQNRLLKGFQALNTLDQIEAARSLSQTHQLALVGRPEQSDCVDLQATEVHGKANEKSAAGSD
jgi:hypothetical protein